MLRCFIRAAVKTERMLNRSIRPQFRNSVTLRVVIDIIDLLNLKPYMKIMKMSMQKKFGNVLIKLRTNFYVDLGDFRF